MPHITIDGRQYLVGNLLPKGVVWKDFERFDTRKCRDLWLNAQDAQLELDDKLNGREPYLKNLSHGDTFLVQCGVKQDWFTVCIKTNNNEYRFITLNMAGLRKLQKNTLTLCKRTHKVGETIPTRVINLCEKKDRSVNVLPFEKAMELAEQHLGNKTQTIKWDKIDQGSGILLKVMGEEETFLIIQRIGQKWVSVVCYMLSW